MAEVLANVTRLPMPGMVLIRARDQVARAAAAALEMDIPATGRRVSNADRMLLWMSPDETLLICPLPEVPQIVARLNAALAGQFALVADVSDMRALFAVEGGRATQALAKLMPVDFDALPDDGVRRTRAGQVHRPARSVSKALRGRRSASGSRAVRRSASICGEVR